MGAAGCRRVVGVETWVSAQLRPFNEHSTVDIVAVNSHLRSALYSSQHHLLRSHYRLIAASPPIASTTNSINIASVKPRGIPLLCLLSALRCAASKHCSDPSMTSTRTRQSPSIPAHRFTHTPRPATQATSSASLSSCLNLESLP